LKDLWWWKWVTSQGAGIEVLRKARARGIRINGTERALAWQRHRCDLLHARGGTYNLM
jgi:hypothetical protein